MVRQLVQKGHTDVAHHVAAKMKTKEDRELLYQDLYQTWKNKSNATKRFTVGCFVLKVPLFFFVTALTIMLTHLSTAFWAPYSIPLTTMAKRRPRNFTPTFGGKVDKWVKQ